MLPISTLTLSPLLYFIPQSLLPNLLSNLSRRDAYLTSSKIVGACHGVFAGGMALREMLDPRWKRNDLIHTNSIHGDRIVALEWGYLLQDTLYLLLHRRSLKDPRFVRRVLAHHIIVLSLLTAYFRAVQRGTATGVFFVAGFIVLNLSTPLRYLEWGLKKYTNTPKPLMLLIHALTMSVYATVRFGLLWYQVWVYSQRKGLSWIEAFNVLRLVCRIGITTLATASAVRFIQISRTYSKRIR